MDRAWGVDVSHHHPVIDWDALVASGASFFGAKATNGQGEDRTFYVHRDEARKHPFDLVIYYHFPTPRSSAVSQADHFVNRVTLGGGLRDNERMALDVEEWDPDLHTGPDMLFVEEFTREVERLIGDRRQLTYTSDRIWKSLLRSAPWPSAILTDLWSPRYGSEEPVLPTDRSGLPIWPKWTFWQDSEKFSCPGIQGQCDHNVFNGDRAALQAYAKHGV